MPDKACCGNCKYWRAGEQRGFEYVPAVCRRLPAFVQKTPDEWCGEYVRKPGQTATAAVKKRGRGRPKGGGSAGQGGV